MSLCRKVRRVGSSLVITIPSQIAEFYEIAEGMEMEIIVEKGKIILQKRMEKQAKTLDKVIEG